MYTFTNLLVRGETEGGDMVEEILGLKDGGGINLLFKVVFLSSLEGLLFSTLVSAAWEEVVGTSVEGLVKVWRDLLATDLVNFLVLVDSLAIDSCGVSVVHYMNTMVIYKYAIHVHTCQ